MSQLVSGTYKTNSGDYDGMHSFESRKSDGFGGKMHTKINEALKNFYTTNKLNPYISSIKITMDDTKFIVNWEVTIEESPDGKAWVGLTSRGGAGKSLGDDGSIKRAWNQILSKKKDLPGEVSKKTITADIADYNFKAKISGWGIRQIFVLYTNPDSYPDLPKSANLQAGSVGVSITVNPSKSDNNGQLLSTSSVGSTPGSVTTTTTADVAKGGTPSAGTVDGTSVSTGGGFQFVTLKNSFISVPPRRNGSVPVFLFYPKNEVLETEEERKNGYFSFSLGNDKINGTYSGIKLANRILDYNSNNFLLFGNSLDQELTSKKDSPLKEWFNKYVMVFPNYSDTDYNKTLDEIKETIESRTLTVSSLNLTAYGESTYPTTPLMQSLTNAANKVKSLILMEPYPSKELTSISNKVKSSGGQVYYTFNPNNFSIKLSDTKTLSSSGLSYSGIEISPDLTGSLGSLSYKYISQTASLYLNGSTISQISSTDKASELSKTLPVYVNYYGINSVLGNTGSGGTPSSSTIGVTYSFIHNGLNNSLPFTYTYMSDELIKSGAYVYNILLSADKNKEKSGGTNSIWPPLKIEPISQSTGQSASGTSSALNDYTIRYLDLSTYDIGPRIENIPQFTFQIFSNEIEKQVGKSANSSSPNDPPAPKLRGEFIFDVRKKGYLINDQLGEFKIIGKVEIDLFTPSTDDDLSGLSPEYTEVEFAGEEEAPENIPEVEAVYVEDEGSSQVNDTSTTETNTGTSTSTTNTTSTTTISGSGVKLPTGPSAYSHNSTQGYNLVDSKWYGDLLVSAIAHLDHPTFDIPNTDKGALGCASWVSMVFYRAFGVHMKDGSAVKKVPKSIGDFGSEGTGALGGWFGQNPGMWEKIPWKEGKPGDVINTERGSKAGHVGIVMNTINKDGSYDVASNSSKGFGSKGDPQGCGKLNYSIKKWQSVTDRNPTRTFCWRYKGPKLSQGQSA